MAFYEYRQNNSGGGFDFDDSMGISTQLIIEAPSAYRADQIAESIGLYFDGCETGFDCSCCGDRWSTAWGEGSEEPTIYGQPVADWGRGQWDMKWQKDGDFEIFVHYLDGRIVGYGATLSKDHLLELEE